MNYNNTNNYNTKVMDKSKLYQPKEQCYIKKVTKEQHQKAEQYQENWMWEAGGLQQKCLEIVFYVLYCTVLQHRKRGPQRNIV